jgi:hypothetical protein
MTFRVAFPALVVAAALALAFGEGSAKAAAPSGGISNPSVAWGGQFYGVPVIDPTLCLAGALDPLNLTCDHFSLDVPAAGTEQVSIGWSDPANDFDLQVYDSAGTLVAESNADGTTSESATFPASPGRYEVRVVPFFVVLSGYQGSASWSASPSSRKKEVVKQRMFGGGVPLPAFDRDARFEMDVRVIMTASGQQIVRGKFRYREGKVFLRSKQILSAEGGGIDNKGGTMQVTGTMNCNGQDADFFLEASDNGPGVADKFDIDSATCAEGHTGPRSLAEAGAGAGPAPSLFAVDNSPFG